MTGKFVIFIVIVFTAVAGYRLKSLTFSGAMAAVAVGLAVYIGFDVKGLLLLGIFFATSSLWSKYKSSSKKEMEEKLAKGATRDWRQVLANGGTASLSGIIYYYFNDPLWLIAFAVAISSANSDTWASEIGSLSKKDPIYIRTFTRTAKGTSGAVSPLGSFAALSGSFLIAITTFYLFHLNLLDCFFIFLFGFVGNIIDTIFGAYYQQKFICQVCGMETEKKEHCNRPTLRIKGFTLVDNDMVNFLSGFIAVLLTIGIMQLLK